MERTAPVKRPPDTGASNSAARHFAKLRRLGQIANPILFVALIGWTVFILLRACPHPGQPFEHDYGLNLEQSTTVLNQHTFPSGFTYPLPCVLLRYCLYKIAGNYSGFLWISLIAAAMVFIVRPFCREFYQGDTRFMYLYVLLAFFPISYYLDWDLRALNCNLIVLGVVLASVFCLKRRADFMCGFFLSVGVALKLYPIVIVPYLLLRRKFRAVVSALLWIVAFFVVIPAIALGGSNFMELTRKWFENVAATGSPDFLAHLVAEKTSLHYTILCWLSNNMPASLQTTSLEWASHFVSLLKMVIAALALLYFFFDFRSPSWLKETDQIHLNIVLILTASLLFSELLQPHHGVFLFGASLLIMNFALHGPLPVPERWAVIGIALLPFIMLKVTQPGVPKALAMNFHIVLYILLLVYLRFRAQGKPAT